MMVAPWIVPVFVETRATGTGRRETDGAGCVGAAAITCGTDIGTVDAGTLPDIAAEGTGGAAAATTEIAETRIGVTTGMVDAGCAAEGTGVGGETGIWAGAVDAAANTRVVGATGGVTDDGAGCADATVATCADGIGTAALAVGCATRVATSCRGTATATLGAVIAMRPATVVSVTMTGEVAGAGATEMAPAVAAVSCLFSAALTPGVAFLPSRSCPYLPVTHVLSHIHELSRNTTLRSVL